MDIFSIACTLQNTVYELHAKLIPPLHVEAILEAAITRLEQLTRDPKLAHFGRIATVPANNPLRNNQLHASQMK